MKKTLNLFPKIKKQDKTNLVSIRKEIEKEVGHVKPQKQAHSQLETFIKQLP